MTPSTAAAHMIAFYRGDLHDINHFLKVWTFARIIGEQEQLDPHTQLGLQFGARYVRSTFDGDRYSGASTLYGFDARRDLTTLFDIGLHGTLLRSLRSNVEDQSVGLDVGVTLARNVWISIGYNFAGFRDDDFDVMAKHRLAT